MREPPPAPPGGLPAAAHDLGLAEVLGRAARRDEQQNVVGCGVRARQLGRGARPLPSARCSIACRSTPGSPEDCAPSMGFSMSAIVGTGVFGRSAIVLLPGALAMEAAGVATRIIEGVS